MILATVPDKSTYAKINDLEILGQEPRLCASHLNLVWRVVQSAELAVGLCFQNRVKHATPSCSSVSGLCKRGRRNYFCGWFDSFRGESQFTCRPHLFLFVRCLQPPTCLCDWRNPDDSPLSRRSFLQAFWNWLQAYLRYCAQHAAKRVWGRIYYWFYSTASFGEPAPNREGLSGNLWSTNYAFRD